MNAEQLGEIGRNIGEAAAIVRTIAVDVKRAAKAMAESEAQEIAAEDGALKALVDCIDRDPAELFKLQPFTQDDWYGYGGAEGSDPHIAHISSQGIVGDIVVDATCVEVHFHDMNSLPTFSRTFPPVSGAVDAVVDLYADERLTASSFADWLIVEMQKPRMSGFGIDDFVEKCGMTAIQT